MQLKIHTQTECDKAGAYTIQAKMCQYDTKAFVWAYGVSDRGFPPPWGWKRTRIVIPTTDADEDAVITAITDAMAQPPGPEFITVARRRGCLCCPHCPPKPISIEGDDVTFTAEFADGCWTGHGRITCANPPDAITQHIEWEFDFAIRPRLEEYEDFQLFRLSLPHPHYLSDGMCYDPRATDIAKALFCVNEPASAIRVLLEALRTIDSGHWPRFDLLHRLDAFRCDQCREILPGDASDHCAYCGIALCPACTHAHTTPHGTYTTCEYCAPDEPLNPDDYTFTKEGVPETHTEGFGDLCPGMIVRLNESVSEGTQYYAGLVTPITRTSRRYSFNGTYRYYVHVQVDKGRFLWSVNDVEIAVPVSVDAETAV